MAYHGAAICNPHGLKNQACRHLRRCRHKQKTADFVHKGKLDVLAAAWQHRCHDACGYPLCRMRTCPLVAIRAVSCIEAPHLGGYYIVEISRLGTLTPPCYEFTTCVAGHALNWTTLCAACRIEAALLRRFNGRAKADSRYLSCLDVSWSH